MQYQLTGLVVHAGLNADYGHYYALGKTNDGWFILNDSDASPVGTPLHKFIDKINGFKSDTVYIMSYELCRGE